MTKKHYKLVAEMMCKLRPIKEDTPSSLLWEAIVDNLCDIFYAENRKFNHTKFMDACDGF